VQKFSNCWEVLRLFDQNGTGNGKRIWCRKTEKIKEITYAEKKPYL